MNNGHFHYAEKFYKSVIAIEWHPITYTVYDGAYDTNHEVGNMSEIKDWCKANCTHRVALESVVNNSRLFFESEKDAIYFVLKHVNAKHVHQ